MSFKFDWPLRLASSEDYPDNHMRVYLIRKMYAGNNTISRMRIDSNDVFQCWSLTIYSIHQNDTRIKRSCRLD